MKKYIVTNPAGTKGIICEAKEAHEAKELAKEYFYSPFPRKNDLCVVQVYQPNDHMFIRATGNTLFRKVQFHTMGGVSTSYDCAIDTLPTDRQLAFLNRPIEYILFTQSDKIPS